MGIWKGNSFPCNCVCLKNLEVFFFHRWEISFCLTCITHEKIPSMETKYSIGGKKWFFFHRWQNDRYRKGKWIQKFPSMEKWILSVRETNREVSLFFPSVEKWILLMWEFRNVSIEGYTTFLMLAWCTNFSIDGNMIYNFSINAPV